MSEEFNPQRRFAQRERKGGKRSQRGKRTSIKKDYVALKRFNGKGEDIVKRMSQRKGGLNKK